MLGHSPDRHARILAGPGTGKSATVIEWISRRPGIRAKLLTFTRAATAELVEKLANRTDLTLEKPSTIHSYCISVLLNNGGVGEFPRPFRMADDWETDEIVEPTLARRLRIRKKAVEKLFAELAANWESLVPEESAEVRPEARARFMGNWREHREILGYALLSELPYALRSALHDHSDLQGVDHQVLVVDEYQDLNACDLEILRLIAARGSSIIAAGDDDQSIYSFRKAHPVGIRNFLAEYGNAADYPLTITRRCAKNIARWANYIIPQDTGRDPNRGSLRSAETAQDGEVALLSFRGHIAEAKGIGSLVEKLINVKHLPAQEVLILLRGDHNGQFSRPIKEELTRRNILFSDPSDLKKVIAEPANRKALAILRLAINREDSLAWASVFRLEPGIGATFFDYVYERARAARTTFGSALLIAQNADFPGLSSALKNRATAAMERTLQQISALNVPQETPVTGWGSYIAETFTESCPTPITQGFVALLAMLDGRVERGDNLDRYLGQITPVAKDIALQKNGAVRIMSLASSKGLTVKATIIAGVETGVIPMDGCDRAEECRLLYVGMTRAEEFLFCTWAQRRRGPTARSGREQVNELRQLSTFLEGGPVRSQDGNTYISSLH